MSRDLTRRVTWITGASSGIGAATAVAFARAGARVALSARRAEALEEVAARCREAGGEPMVAPCDVTDREQVRAAARAIADRWERIDLLVNNAGVGLYRPVAELSAEELQRCLAVNVTGALWCVQAVLPAMRRRGSGRIINVSSVIGKRSMPWVGGYCASKFALQALSEALRAEVAEDGVRVSVVCPGLTATPFFDQAIGEWPSGAARLRGASPESVAAAILRVARTGRAEVHLTGSGRLLVQLNRFFPRLVDWAMVRYARRRDRPAPAPSEAS